MATWLAISGYMDRQNELLRNRLAEASAGGMTAADFSQRFGTDPSKVPSRMGPVDLAPGGPSAPDQQPLVNFATTPEDRTKANVAKFQEARSGLDYGQGLTPNSLANQAAMEQRWNLPSDYMHNNAAFNASLPAGGINPDQYKSQYDITPKGTTGSFTSYPPLDRPMPNELADATIASAQKAGVVAIKIPSQNDPNMSFIHIGSNQAKDSTTMTDLFVKAGNGDSAAQAAIDKFVETQKALTDEKSKGGDQYVKESEAIYTAKTGLPLTPEQQAKLRGEYNTITHPSPYAAMMPKQNQPNTLTQFLIEAGAVKSPEDLTELQKQQEALGRIAAAGEETPKKAASEEAPAFPRSSSAPPQPTPSITPKTPLSPTPQVTPQPKKAPAKLVAMKDLATEDFQNVTKTITELYNKSGLQGAATALARYMSGIKASGQERALVIQRIIDSLPIPMDERTNLLLATEATSFK